MPGTDWNHYCYVVTTRVKQILQRLVDYGESTAPVDNIVFAMNQTRGAVSNRIFNSEAGTKDVSGAGLGKYSNSYAEYRKSKGRQANVVDLEFTGSLRRNLQVVQLQNKVTLAVVSNTERLKVGYLEKQYRKDIFSVSSNERNEFFQSLNELYKQDIKNILTGEY